MFLLLSFVCFVASASAKDLIVGQDSGTLKIEQNFTATPTIWRQEKKITFNVSDSEVITKVAIIDHREDKNGEATIIEGGEGQKNVTIELKSPAVFRGFEFEVQVYAKEGEIQQSNANDQQSVQSPFLQDTNVNDKQVPKDVTGDVVKVIPTQVANSQDKVQTPIEIEGEKTQEVRQNRDVQVTEQRPLSVMIDDIFTENKNGAKSTKTSVEPTKPTEGMDDSQQIDIKGVAHTNVPSSTVKSIDVEQKEKSVEQMQITQQKGQLKVPLPYINH